MPTQDDTASIPFTATIKTYRHLATQHTQDAKVNSRSIVGLIAVGLFIVIALPYLLNLADKLFRRSHSVDVVEDKITSVENRIEKTITTIPDLLAFPVFTEFGSEKEIYYPGLRPLSSAIFSDKDIAVVTD